MEEELFWQNNQYTLMDGWCFGWSFTQSHYTNHQKDLCSRPTLPCLLLDRLSFLSFRDPLFHILWLFLPLPFVFLFSLLLLIPSSAQNR